MTYVLDDEVVRLLQQYQQYKTTNALLSQVSTDLAKAKIAGTDTTSLRHEYTTNKQTLQDISDAMTFVSPHIWIQYKYEAYKDEPQPILNLHDLRLHCSKPGYICTKRYTFVNQWLVNTGQQPLSDTQAYPGDVSLRDLLQTGKLQALTKHTQFIQHWREYEYYMVGDRVAKWENYVS